MGARHSCGQFTYCHPALILRNILHCLWAHAGRGRARSGRQCARTGGGGGCSGAGRRAGKRGGRAKRRILTSPSMLSLSRIACQESNCSAAQHKKTTPRKESPTRNPPPSGIARPITLSSESERAGKPYRITPTTQSKKYMTISPSDCFLFPFRFLNCARNCPPGITCKELPARNCPPSGIARPCPPVT